MSEPGDAIVRVTTTSIGPADLERYAGPDPWGPVAPGGACAGVVEATGEEVRRWRPADSVVVPTTIRVVGIRSPAFAVFGRDLPGSHSGWVRVPAADGNLVSLPDPLVTEAQAVVAAEAYAIGTRAAVRLAAGPRLESVCVVGCDTACLAFISAWKSLKDKAAEAGPLVAADTAPGRVMLARRMGALGVVLGTGASQAGAIRERASREAFGAVVVGSKVEGASLETARQLAAPGASVILLDPPGVGWSTDRAPSGDTDATVTVAGFPSVSEIEALVASVQVGGLDLLPFISHTFPLAEAGTAFESALKRERGFLKVLMKG